MRSTVLTFDFLKQLFSTHLAGWQASQSALWRCSRHQQQQWTAAAVVRSPSLLSGVDSPADSYILNAAHQIFGATITSLFESVLLLY